MVRDCKPLNPVVSVDQNTSILFAIQFTMKKTTLDVIIISSLNPNFFKTEDVGKSFGRGFIHILTQVQ